MMTRRQEQPEEDATGWSARHSPYSYRMLSDVGDLGVVKDLTGLLNHIRCYRDGRDAPPDELSCKLWVHRRALSADGHGAASRGAGFDYMLNGLKHGGVAFVEHLGKLFVVPVDAQNQLRQVVAPDGHSVDTRPVQQKEIRGQFSHHPQLEVGASLQSLFSEQRYYAFQFGHSSHEWDHCAHVGVFCANSLEGFDLQSESGSAM